MTTPTSARKVSSIAFKSDEKQIVYGVVYAPGEIDAHGETMFAADIEQMAHDFMRRSAEKGGNTIDVQHDNVPISAYPVESYIETEEGKDWPVGSWIMGVKIEDAGVWKKIKKGELNGFSFEAMVYKVPMVAEVSYFPDDLGITAENEGHDHVYFIEYDEEGRIVGGETSYDAGHRHTIKMGTATDLQAAPGLNLHSHRILV